MWVALHRKIIADSHSSTTCDFVWPISFITICKIWLYSNSIASLFPCLMIAPIDLDGGDKLKISYRNHRTKDNIYEKFTYALKALEKAIGITYFSYTFAYKRPECRNNNMSSSCAMGSCYSNLLLI